MGRWMHLVQDGCTGTAKGASATAELAATYAALILADDNVEITADKIVALITAANVEVEPIWATLLAKALEGKNVKELLSNVGAGGGAPATGAPSAAAGGAAAAADEPAAEEKKEEEKEESDDDMGFGLFD
ncbi:60s acidic ribosomal protein-domain-containing protein [Cytidiella melzeri]|nr:60s acidic ribosomal protein-domain-containing protein [Cytidiella melzeri]